MKFRWTRKRPFYPLRQRVVGLFVEWTVVFLLLLGFALIGHFIDVLSNGLLPFQYKSMKLSDCCDSGCWIDSPPTTWRDCYCFDEDGTMYSCFFDYADLSYPYKAAAGVGCAVWILSSVILLSIKLHQRCNAKPHHSSRDELKQGSKRQDLLAVISIAHIAYHVLRWPLFLGILATGNPLAITLGYWLDSIALVLILLIAGAVKALRAICREVRNDLDALKREKESK